MNLCSESTTVVNTDAIEMWFEKLSKLLQGYEDCDIYNAEKTGLFYKCLSERKLTFKRETCHYGKHSKEMLTTLLCSYKYSSDKRVSLIIDKSTLPRCFKNE